VWLSKSNRTASNTSGPIQGAVANVQWSSGTHAFAVQVDKYDKYRAFTVGVSPPDVDVEDGWKGLKNASGIHWYARNGVVIGGGNARSKQDLNSGHDILLINVGTVVEICVVFGGDGTADVSVTLDGNLRGVMARGLRGPLCPAVFLDGDEGEMALTLLRHS